MARIGLYGLALSAALVLAPESPLLAAENYKVGESVEVLFLNSWLPAKVLEVNKRGLVRGIRVRRHHEDRSVPA